MATGFAAERQAIESRFQAAWALTPHAAVPVRYENVVWQPPDKAPYLVLSIIRGEGDQIILGRPTTGRWAGVIQIDVVVPELTGTATALGLADAAAAPFDGTQFEAGGSGLITCRKPSVRSLGIRDSWHRHVLRVEYHRDIL